jgi:hypothetical protein
MAESGSVPWLDPEQKPPGITPGGFPRASALAYSLLSPTWKEIQSTGICQAPINLPWGHRQPDR